MEDGAGLAVRSTTVVLLAVLVGVLVAAVYEHLDARPADADDSSPRKANRLPPPAHVDDVPGGGVDPAGAGMPAGVDSSGRTEKPPAVKDDAGAQVGVGSFDRVEPPSAAADDGSGVNPRRLDGQYALSVVQRVIDGDTIADSVARYRLSLVNTPEKGQAGHAEARDLVAGACPAGSMFAYDQDAGQPYDRYGRILAKVWCGEGAVEAVRFGADPGPSINEMLLDGGYACIYTGFARASEFGAEEWVDGRPAC